MKDFTKIPDSYEIGAFIEKVAWFYAHELLQYETVTTIGSDIAGNFATLTADKLAEDEEALEKIENPTVTEVVECLVSTAKSHGLDLVVGFSKTLDTASSAEDVFQSNDAPASSD